MERFEHGGDIYANQGITLDFSVNTNPFGMPEKVIRALISRVKEFANYPDPKCRELRTAISRQEGVPVDWVLCGNGAADLIYRLCYALKPRRALVCAPTFSEYERALEQTECHVAHYSLTAGNQFVLKENIVDIITHDLDILFLCNPNNPTGRLIPKTVLELILNRACKNGMVVVVDECFLNFTSGGVSCKDYLNKMPGLFVIKAFTKMYAMAGLRLGYLLSANVKSLKKINAASQYWSVSVPAQIAGVTALSCVGWEEKTLRLIATEREYLLNQLNKLVGITVFPSDANYLLLQCKQPIYEMLLKKGILVRSCKNFRGLNADYYRICVKKRDENIRLIKMIKEILHG